MLLLRQALSLPPRPEGSPLTPVRGRAGDVEGVRDRGLTQGCLCCWRRVGTSPAVGLVLVHLRAALRRGPRAAPGGGSAVGEWLHRRPRAAVISRVGAACGRVSPLCFLAGSAHELLGLPGAACSGAAQPGPLAPGSFLRRVCSLAWPLALGRGLRLARRLPWCPCR